MGVVKNIDINSYPKQSSFVGLDTDVCFNYDTRNIVKGTIVRCDDEDPGLTIIALQDGRYVMSTECQWSPNIGSNKQQG